MTLRLYFREDKTKKKNIHTYTYYILLKKDF